MPGACIKLSRPSKGLLLHIRTVNCTTWRQEERIAMNSRSGMDSWWQQQINSKHSHCKPDLKKWNQPYFRTEDLKWKVVSVHGLLVIRAVYRNRDKLDHQFKVTLLFASDLEGISLERGNCFSGGWKSYRSRIELLATKEGNCGWNSFRGWQ